MEGASIEAAVARIESALTRLNDAAVRQAERVATSQTTPTDDGLAERHERLREAVSSSLRQLDSLLRGAAS